MRRTRLLFLCGSFVGFAGGVTLLLMQPGCTKGQCTQSVIDPNAPSSALECAANHFCYQGQCVRACSAGQERAQACKSDGDCGGVRPNCVDDFCSACDQGELCVYTLNICQAVTEIDTTGMEPPPPPPPGAPKPPAPLEEGWIDGGIRLDRDAGEDVPVDAVVTHAGLIDIAQLEDYTGGGQPIRSSLINVNLLYVGDVQDPGLTWRVDPWNDVGDYYEPSTETPIEEVLGEDCALLYLQSYTASVALEPVDFGDIRIDSAPDFDNSLSVAGGIQIPWDGFDYLVPMNLPVDLLRYSILSPSEPHFLTVSSAGGEVAGAWPNPLPDNGEHVPFALAPSAETVTLLASGANISIAQPGDLVVRWAPISVGSVPGESVVLRFRGDKYEVNCRGIEGNVNINGAIVVKAGLLRSFIMSEGIIANDELPLYFERVYARRLEVPPTDMGQVIDVAVRIRHTFVGTIRFQ